MTESRSDGASGVAGMADESRLDSREEDIGLVVVRGDAIEIGSNPGVGSGGMEGRGAGGGFAELGRDCG